MREFYISIKKDGGIFRGVNKYGFDLDPSWNIAAQAESEVASILDILSVPEAERRGISWKVFQNDGRGFRWVTRSENWVD